MKGLISVFGVFSYAVGMGGLVYFILYVGAWDFLPLHINSREAGDLTPALIVNLALMALFGVHHSIAARPGFKRLLTRILPEAAERSSYVLMSGVLMMVICLFWQPIEGTVWHASDSWLQLTLVGLYGLGWVMVVASSFLIDHFELFGLRQVYINQFDLPTPDDSFTERGFYRLVRHPIQLGVFIGIWATPTMTMTQLMLAVTMTIYIAIGLYFEEKDLVSSLGEDYESYRRRVRKLLPLPVLGKGRDKPLIL